MDDDSNEIALFISVGNCNPNLFFLMNNLSNHYIPGTCNIGIDEITKRKAELAIGIIVTFSFTSLSFWFQYPLIMWLLLFVFSGYTILMYFQVSNRFCVLFGWLKRYNFGTLGNQQKINDPGQVARDRKKVLVIGLQTLVISVVYTGLIYSLSLWIHF